MTYPRGCYYYILEETQTINEDIIPSAEVIRKKLKQSRELSDHRKSI